MKQQGSYSKTDLLDLSVLPSSESLDRNAWRDQTIDLHDSHLTAQDSIKRNLSVYMSNEESKIRGELETDIERDLEEELKDGIYHLALRLHRLYQHQKIRNARELSESGTTNDQGTNNKTLSEVNINIRMEGGTKIEIKEIKKEAPERGRPRTSRFEAKQGMVAPNTKKFDWVKTLRSGAGPVAISKKNDSSHQARILSNGPSLYPNHKLDNARRNCTSASGQRKGNVRLENKLFELGWRS